MSAVDLPGVWLRILEGLGVAAETERPDVEPRGRGEAPTRAKKERRALRNLRRELSDEELQSPAVQKMLMDELERLEADRDEWKERGERFHERDAEVGILRERLKVAKGLDVVHAGTLVIGSLLIGYAPAVWSQQPTGWLALVAGGVLIGAALFAKVVRR